MTGVQVTGPLTTTAPSDTYPTHKANLGFGGFMEVADDAAKLAITTDRREAGMLVHVLSPDGYWTLIGGIADINWTPVTFGGAGSYNIRFVGNGEFPIDQNVDGAWIAPANCTIQKITVDVKERGKNDGSITDNIWDVKINGTSVFSSTPANKPTIAASAGGGQANADSGTPDTTAIVAGDRVTIDTEQIVNGSLLPSDFTLEIQVVY